MDTENNPPPTPVAAPSPVAVEPPPERGRGGLWKLAGVAILAIVAFAIWRLTNRESHAAPPPERTITAAAVPATRQDLTAQDEFYAELRPYQEVELHAKVSGFLDKMFVDFGDKVAKDKLLVTIEVPELHDELASAEATEQEMEASYGATHLQYQRTTNAAAVQPGLIAQQQIDDIRARDLKDEKAVAEAKAEVNRLRTLLSYTQITAPFPGVITWRYVDPGALIQAGTSGNQSLPLLRLSQNDLLRLDFPVELSAVTRVREGTPVVIRFQGFEQALHSTVTRITRRVDANTRKMTAEVEIPNPDLKLVPGMYATVTVQVDERKQAIAVPPEAIHRGEHTNVLVAVNNIVAERPVTLGLETPHAVEIVSGLAENDFVLIGGGGLLHPGDHVTLKMLSASDTK